MHCLSTSVTFGTDRRAVRGALSDILDVLEKNNHTRDLTRMVL